MNHEAEEELGQAIDRVDNLAHALKLPLSPNMHVDQLRAALPEAVADLKAAFVKLTGDNPWE